MCKLCDPFDDPAAAATSSATTTDAATDVSSNAYLWAGNFAQVRATRCLGQLCCSLLYIPSLPCNWNHKPELKLTVPPATAFPCSFAAIDI